MPMSVSLGAHFEEFVQVQVTSGRYNNASEVLRDGLRLLQDQDELRRAKLEWLKEAIKEGLESGPATPLDMAEVRAEGQRLRAKRLAAAGTKA